MATQKFQGLFSPLEVVSTNNLLRIEQDRCQTAMTKIYYSDFFKVFYVVLLSLSATCLAATVLELFFQSVLTLALEITVTTLLVFDTAYRIIMQGCRSFFKHTFNVFDIFIIAASLALLWAGAKIEGGVGRVNTFSAALVIGVRSLVQFIRLVININRKKAQNVQMIDLNDMSEADDIHLHKKNKNGMVEEHKNEYQESQPEAIGS